MGSVPVLGQKGSTEEYRYVVSEFSKNFTGASADTKTLTISLGDTTGCDYWEIWGGLHKNTDTYLLTGRAYQAYNGISSTGSGSMTESGNTLTMPGPISFTLERRRLTVEVTNLYGSGDTAYMRALIVLRYKN